MGADVKIIMTEREALVLKGLIAGSFKNIGGNSADEIANNIKEFSAIYDKINMGLPQPDQQEQAL